MDMKLSRYHVATPRFIDQEDQRPRRLVFATRTAEVLVIDEASWQALAEGALDRLPAPLRSELTETELLVPAGEDELATVLGRNNAAARDDENLSLVIQPTAFCQLGCGYCGQEHLPRWLNQRHQDALLARTRAKLASGSFRRLEVCWFGAEPLSGINVIRSLTPRLKRLAEEFDCPYGAVIITNGLALTGKVATEIVRDHAVESITLSLDGTAAFHDARRHKKGGQPTFHTIFANVVALARRTDLDVEIKIRCNVDRRNVDGVASLLRLLAEAGVQERIRFYVAPIHSWGNDAHTLSLAPEEFADRELEWFGEMLRLGFAIGFVPTLKPVVCLAVQPHGELIDAMGNLFNCTEVSYVPAYGTPNRFAIGHVASGEVRGQRDLLGDFNARVGRGEYPCSSCRMLPVCGGACPKAWQDGHEPCPSAKRNIEGRLLLSYAAARAAATPGTGGAQKLPKAELVEAFDR